jgi:membrane-bound ClpP family serine protease
MTLLSGAWPLAAATALWAAVGILFGLCVVFLWRIVRLGWRMKSLCGEALVGEIGEARTSLDPNGFVTVRSRSYPAASGTSIAAGEQVRVTAGNKILAVERYNR